MNIFYFSIYNYRTDLYQENLENKKNQTIHLSNNEILNYSKKWIFDFGGTSLSQDMKIYPDLNEDGYDDIILVIYFENNTRVYALTHNGEILWNTTDFRPGLVTYDGALIRSFGANAWYFPSTYDENDDGIMDILGEFSNNNSGILDGRNGEILWEDNPFGARNSIVGLLADFSGDGKPEILMKNNLDYGVLNSSSKTKIWTNTYPFYPHINPIPDIDGDGIWDVITAANYVDHIDCWSGANGTNIWSHPIGFDSWGEAVCPDQNGDGYFDILVTPQASEFELISGKTGNQIWGSGFSRSGYPKYCIDENGNKYAMHDDEGILRSYYLLNGVFISHINCLWTKPHCFLSNSNYDPGIYQLIFLNESSIGLYPLGNYFSPIQIFDGNWTRVSPYYGNSLCSVHDLIFINKSCLAFYTEPLRAINGKDEIPIFIIVSTTVGSVLLIISALYIMRKKGIILHSKRKVEYTEGRVVSKSDSETLEPPPPLLRPKKVVYLSCSELDFKHFDILTIVKRLESYPDIDKVIFQKIGETQVGGEYMEQKLRDSNVFLLFCSSNTMNSEKLKDEWQPAFQLRKKGLMKMIPVFENDEDIPVVLLHLPRIEFSKNTFDEFIETLHKEIIRRD